MARPSNSFAEPLRALLVQEGNTGEFTYFLNFTTETTTSSNAAGTNTVSLTGMRLVEGPNYVQLAATVTNKTNAFLESKRRERSCEAVHS